MGAVSTISVASASIPTGSYQSFATQSTISTSAASNSTRNTTFSTTSSSTSNTLLLVGPTRQSSTATATSSSASPTNTQPCNNYPELCNQQYMNFTEVCAHNAAFAVKSNAASNQAYGITAQLNDGVRMIQGETHYVNSSLYACHTSCDILNAGTLEDELTTVRQWVDNHPYDVVTILLVNSDFRPITDYVAPIQSSGLETYLYTPPKIPMHLGDWPTLGSMILSGKRVVLFMDYMANQTAVPYVLDEFSQMWETPFSPTNITFPCTQQRPPGLNATQQNHLPYLANHNLNVEFSLGGSSILIPNFASLDQVNSVNGIAGNGTTGTLGAMAETCTQDWDRPPAWLLVDFYNTGNYPGSVFEVAARMNGLNYTRASSCCGDNTGSSAAVITRPLTSSVLGLIVFIASTVFLL